MMSVNIQTDRNERRLALSERLAKIAYPYEAKPWAYLVVESGRSRPSRLDYPNAVIFNTPLLY
jgi:hypothetical protein